MQQLPNEISEVEIFLRSVGLKLQEDTGFREMGDRLIRYGDDHIQVRLVCDRGREWFIEVHDPLDYRDAWTGMALFQTLLTGPDDIELPLEEQARVLKQYWPAILDRLSPRNAQHTHAQLDMLYQKRLRRILPERYQ